jgi:hypothetical protein
MGTYVYNIRAANQAISELPTSTFADQTLKGRLKGEAHFLRAYYYQQLVRYYGSVPMITKVYALNEDYSVPRNTFDECLKFIVSDCDSAALLLKGKSGVKGPCNQGSCIGFEITLAALCCQRPA